MVLKKTQRKIQRHYGKDSHLCRVTNNANGVIRKYGLLMTRRCFREQAKHIGFKKVGYFVSYFVCDNYADLISSTFKYTKFSISYVINFILSIVQVNNKKARKDN